MHSTTLLIFRTICELSIVLPCCCLLFLFYLRARVVILEDLSCNFSQIIVIVLCSWLLEKHPQLSVVKDLLVMASGTSVKNLIRRKGVT